MTTLKAFRRRVFENLQTLKARKARQAGEPELTLVNQIKDHERAISLIDRALATEPTAVTLTQLKQQLRPLVIAANVEQLDVDEIALEQPKLYFEPETVPISGGKFSMGSVAGPDVPPAETPQDEVNLATFHIGTYPVTNDQYAEFIRQTGRIVEPDLLWDGQQPPDDKLNYPVTGVTWIEALAYCQWLAEQTSRNYTLPTEAQWEKAARGADGRTFPWGSYWADGRCNTSIDQITPVDAYPAQNEFGCFDMVGNAREWTSSLWGSKRSVPDPAYAYPWTDDARRHDTAAPSHIRRVYRGGATEAVIDMRCSRRGSYLPDKPGPRRHRHGFRVVLNL
ncbi:MAG: SUMF1/EgtB/PvdO family nonheme iron enzyme [Anaerolineae bacterium]|nr:SUMF1/EgtB/PvdO family nonheme iron enzyme [Anaerolineae bacterium]